MPSGWRSSAPSPKLDRERHRAEHRRHRRHHDRAEAQQAGLVDRVARSSRWRVRSASSAKSIIMIAFFLTMPISRITPISAMTLNSVSNSEQRQHRADAGRRQGRQDRHRVDEALVQHAEHDVDGDQRREDQETAGSAASAGTSRAVPWKLPWIVAGMPMRSSAASIAARASPSATPGARLNEIVVATNGPWWLTASGVLPGPKCGDGGERHHRLGRGADRGAGRGRRRGRSWRSRWSAALRAVSAAIAGGRCDCHLGAGHRAGDRVASPGCRGSSRPTVLT